MKNLTDLLEDLAKSIQAIEEDLSYVELSNQWQDTVHDFATCTALLKELYMLHEVWLSRLQSA